jgi:uncharacterized membrane protein
MYIFDSFLSISLLVILFVVVFVKISGLKARVYRLERLAEMKEVIPAAATSTPIVATAQAPIQTPVETGSGSRFFDWLKEDWLLKLGGLLLLIGFGWFATYAFMNNWIGPAGRITIGILAGIAILALGTFRIKKYINQGGVFLVLGSAVILLTVFAAREWYDMFTPALALGIMFLSAAYVALVSVKYNSFAVALSGLVLSFVAPLLTNGSDNYVALFSYLMVIVLGAIWIVALRKNWGALVFASLIGVFFYSLPAIFDGREIVGPTLLNFAYVFALVFFISSIISIVKSKEGDIKAFLLTAVLNAIFLLSWIMAYAPEDWQSLIIAVWMVIFAGGAFILFVETKIRNVFYVYAAISVAMLATATAIQLDGAALTIAYTIESTLIPLLILLTTRDLKAASASSLLLAGPIFLSLANFADYSNSREVFTKDFFVVALLIIALMILGLIFKKNKKADTTVDIQSDNVLLIIGSAYLYTLIWTSLHNAMYNDYAVATTISLIIFTIIGLVKYFYGISHGSRILRNYGGIFLGLVVLRLIFIDVWDMEMGVKIVVFFLIGILFVSTAFISRRIKNNI